MREIIKNKNLTALIILMLYVVYLVYKRDVGGDDFSKMKLIIPIWLFCLCAHYKYVEYLIIILLPLTYGISTGYIFPFALGCVFLKRKLYPKSAMAFTLVIAILEFVHYPFYSFSADPSPVYYVNYFSAIFIMAYYISVKNNYNVNNLIISFALGSATLGIFVLLNSASVFDVGSLMSGEIRLGMAGLKDDELKAEELKFAVDANVLGMFSIASISSLFTLLYNGYKKKTVVFVLIAICFICGALTLSRTYYLCLAFALFMFVTKYKNGKSNKLLNYLLLAIFIGGIIFFFYKFGGIVDSLLERFRGDKTGSGRTEIFAYYTNYMLNHLDYLLFGGGSLYYMQAAGSLDAIHNGTQQIVACYGLIGLIVFIYPLLKLFRKNYQKSNSSGMYLTTIIIIIFFLQTLQSINPCQQMFPLLPAYWALLFSKYPELKEMQDW